MIISILIIKLLIIKSMYMRETLGPHKTRPQDKASQCRTPRRALNTFCHQHKSWTCHNAHGHTARHLVPSACSLGPLHYRRALKCAPQIRQGSQATRPHGTLRPSPLRISSSAICPRDPHAPSQALLASA